MAQLPRQVPGIGVQDLAQQEFGSNGDDFSLCHLTPLNKSFYQVLMRGSS
jgi:hypothetical protein